MNKCPICGKEWPIDPAREVLARELRKHSNHLVTIYEEKHFKGFHYDVHIEIPRMRYELYLEIDDSKRDWETLKYDHIKDKKIEEEKIKINENSYFINMDRIDKEMTLYNPHLVIARIAGIYGQHYANWFGKELTTEEITIISANVFLRLNGSSCGYSKDLFNKELFMRDMYHIKKAESHLKLQKKLRDHWKQVDEIIYPKRETLLSIIK